IGFNPQGLRPNQVLARWDATSSLLKLSDQGVVANADPLCQFSLRQTASLPQRTEPVSCVPTPLLRQWLPEIGVKHRFSFLWRFKKNICENHSMLLYQAHKWGRTRRRKTAVPTVVGNWTGDGLGPVEYLPYYCVPPVICSVSNIESRGRIQHPKK